MLTPESADVGAAAKISPLRLRLRKVVDAVVGGHIARLLNRSSLSPYFVEHKPEYHWFSKSIPGFPSLYKYWILNNPKNIADTTRFYLLYQNVSRVLDQGLPGDIVELGVYKGNSAAILAYLARKHGRHLYLFDTFSGFDRRDLLGIDARHHAAFEDTSLETVKERVGTDSVTYVQGFFPHSCQSVNLPAKIAVAHVDCDLYEPTKAALDRFYPLVVPGGILVVHDYGSGVWSGVTSALDEFLADRPEKPALMPDKSGTALVVKV
jgi:hypothetical protein